MTIKDLIAQLATYPPNLHVHISGSGKLATVVLAQVHPVYTSKGKPKPKTTKSEQLLILTTVQ